MPRIHPLLWWALRDLRHHAGEVILVGLGLLCVTTMLSTALLTTQGIKIEGVQILDETWSAVVVRRVDSGGAPIPLDVIEDIEKIRGVTSVRHRNRDIAPGRSSEVFIEVFHESEAEALLPEIRQVLPFDVELITREQQIRKWDSTVTTRGGVATLLAMPALLALVLLIIGSMRGRHGHRREVGILRAFGWTTADLVRLQLLGSTIAGLPWVLGGFVASMVLVHFPATRSLGTMLLGWGDGDPLPFGLDLAGIGLALLQLCALVLVPWLVAALWPVLSSASADPAEQLEDGR